MKVEEKKLSSHANKKTNGRKKREGAQADGDAIQTKDIFPIVAIGSSAGGLEALDNFFRLMPADSGMAFILVSHLDPGHESMLTEILQRITRMPVTEATDQLLVKVNHLYVIPPNRDIAILKGSLQLRTPEVVRGLRMPIDYFFRTLADDRGERSIAILLSGTGTDGTMGLRSILGAGGVSFVQEPSTAQYDGMPESAIRNGLATYVLPVHEMPDKLREYVSKGFLTTTEDSSVPSERKSAISRILTMIRSRTGNDFSLYKQNTIRRRLQRRMISQGIDDEETYVKFLASHPEEIDLLFKEFLINVTSFFRDPESFETLRKEVLPTIFENKPEGYVFRFWVPGCATGEEAYSLAILLREQMVEKKRDHKVLIYATDIDGDSIAIARPGIYPPNIAMDISSERLQRFFIREERGYRVKKEIRDMVVFAIQNVIKDPPFTKLDLISCRNLLIYLEAELQNRLVPLFQYALRPGGVLMLGPSESLGPSHDLFSTIDRKWRIFRAKNISLADRSLQIKMPHASDLFIGGRNTPARVGTGGVLPDLTMKMLMKTFGPPSVVTDEGGVLLYVHGETGKFLQPSPGNVSLNVVDMARPGLEMELRAAIQKAVLSKSLVSAPAITVITDNGTRPVDLIVNPFSETEGGRTLLLVSFLERMDVPSTKAAAAKKGRGVNAKRAEELERELDAAKENLQSIVEQMQGSHEELKSTNEELQSTNEELQSTNEELETSKEELQSVNEELISVNSELQSKNVNLLSTQSDLKNLLDNTNIGAIFLDENLVIRRFTRESSRLFRLVATDAGRHLSDIKSRIVGEDIIDDVKSVMEYLVPKERTVRTADDEWFLTRIMPYRTVENSVIGIVLTFTDITELKKIDLALRKTEARFHQLAEQSGTVIWEADVNGLFTYVSKASEAVWGYRSDELVGKKHFYDLVVDAERETVRSKVFEMAKHGERFVGLEHAVHARDGRILWNSTSGIPLLKADGSLRGYQGSDTDITERISAGEALKDSEARFRTMFQESPLGIALLDSRSGRIYELNQRFAEIAGRPQAEMKTVDWMSITHPDDVQKALDQMARLNAGEITGFQMKKRYLRPDGSVVWVNMTIAPLKEQNLPDKRHLCMIEDIDEHMKVENALQDAQEKYRTLFEMTKQGVFFQDQEGRILEANAAARRILGLPPGPMLDRSMLRERYVHQDGSDYSMDDIPTTIALRTGKEVRDIIMGIIPPRKRAAVWVRVNAVPHFKRGEDKPYQVCMTLDEMTATDGNGRRGRSAGGR